MSELRYRSTVCVGDLAVGECTVHRAAGEPHDGAHPTEPSQWHQTPTIINVPDGERWQTERP